MPFRLPPLPFDPRALEPHVSRATIETHYGKHHRAYVDNLNALVRGSPRADWPLERVVQRSHGSLLHQAAQAWNHEFLWHCLRPAGGLRPPEPLRAALATGFGGVAGFQREFSRLATQHFGSGWVWLVADARGRLSIVDLHDEGTPIAEGGRPLLGCDVWEHAYYLDHRHDRAAWLKAFWHVVNWDFVAQNLARPGTWTSAASVRRGSQPAERSAS